MRTVIPEIEAVVNSRLLTYQYADIDKGEPLTPSHFFYGRLTTIPERSVVREEDDEYPDYIANQNAKGMRKRLKLVESSMKRFWKCWRMEYLVNLREFHQVQRSRSILE